MAHVIKISKRLDKVLNQLATILNPAIPEQKKIISNQNSKNKIMGD